jgi:hypothetical protein
VSHHCWADPVLFLRILFWFNIYLFTVYSGCLFLHESVSVACVFLGICLFPLIYLIYWLIVDQTFLRFLVSVWLAEMSLFLKNCFPQFWELNPGLLNGKQVLHWATSLAQCPLFPSLF